MPKKYFILSMIACVLTYFNVAYAEYKIAIADLNRIINSTNEARKKQLELEELTKETEKEYKTRAEKVKDLEKQYASTSDKELGKKLEKEVRDLKLFVSDSKDTIKRKFEETNKKLIKNVMEVVKDYAEDNGIDLVLDKNSVVLGVVVFNENTLDITNELIKKVN